MAGADTVRPDFAAAARLTAAFYAWEERGRGWQLCDYPVELEPPFHPFLLHRHTVRATDDAHKPSLLSGWLDSIFGRTSAPPAKLDEEVNGPEPTLSKPFARTTLKVTLAPDVKVTADISEHFLLSLSTCTSPVSYEVVGTGEAIVVQVVSSTVDALHVREQLQAHFPDAICVEAEDALGPNYKWSAESAVTIDFGLSQEFMRPIRTFARFEADPLLAVTGALSDLAEGEVALLQVLFRPTRAPWAANIMRSVTDWDGEGRFFDAPELTGLAETKVARPLVAAVVRVAARSDRRQRSFEIAKHLGGTLMQFAAPSSNEFMPLDNDGYPDDDHISDVFDRQSRRTGMLLNSEELVSLVHLPSTTVRSPKLKRDERRTKAAPKELASQGLILGRNVHGGLSRDIALTEEQRLRHMHVIGASGTGKSTLLMSLIAQDIEAGNGFAVLDPHGDLIDEVLCRIPERRTGDVVLVDPGDSDYSVGFNVLAAHSELEKVLIASDLVAIFRRLSTSWGDQMTSVLANAVLAFLESTQGGTIADLRRFLVEADYRKESLATVTDPEVVYYWQKEFPLLTGRPQAPLLTRLDAFLRPQMIRRMVTQPTSLDIGAVMNDGRILLVKLAQGVIGEENASLLGSLLVAKVTQLAMGRQAIKKSERAPFYLYIDEFQHFVTPSMATLMTGARKYRLGLVLAHQELRQLLNQDRDVAGAVLANAATRIAFRVGDDDAKRLEDGFSTFSARDIQNLERGQAVCRIDRADWDFSLAAVPLALLTSAAYERGQAIGKASSKQHGTRHVSAERFPAAPIHHQAMAAQSHGATTQAEPEGLSVASPTRFPKDLAIVSSAGRGGAQHRYLQELIRRWGEANGWRATVERRILDGLGSIDVALEKDNYTVACEVSVSSTVEYELGNIRKSLAAGFQSVISIVPEMRARQKLSQAVAASIDASNVEQVKVMTLEELFCYLGSIEGRKTIDNVSKGYRVTVQRGPLAAPTKSITKTVLRALKRLNDNGRSKKA
jgi:hypothetical protein